MVPDSPNRSTPRGFRRVPTAEPIQPSVGLAASWTLTSGRLLHASVISTWRWLSPRCALAVVYARRMPLCQSM